MKTFFLFFFGEHLRLCPWSLASSIPVLGLESVCPRKGGPWPWPRIFFVSLALASSLVSSTPPLHSIYRHIFFTDSLLKLQQSCNTLEFIIFQVILLFPFSVITVRIYVTCLFLCYMTYVLLCIQLMTRFPSERPAFTRPS